MNSTHRIVKYFAYGLAASIIGSIIMLSLGILKIVSTIFINNDEFRIKKTYDILETKNITKLSVELSTSNLIIKEGPSFKIESTSNNISIDESKDMLKIKEKNNNKFKEEKVYIYIPYDYYFDIVDISNGSGDAIINNLNANELTYEIGAGIVSIEYINILNKSTINCGTGKLNIYNSILNNLDLNLGVGDSYINSKILGNSKIRSGIGSLLINIMGTVEDYKFNVNKGIGTVTINKNIMSDDLIYGEGTNFIELESGIGSVEVNFYN